MGEVDDANNLEDNPSQPPSENLQHATGKLSARRIDASQAAALVMSYIDSCKCTPMVYTIPLT